MLNTLFHIYVYDFSDFGCTGSCIQGIYYYTPLIKSWTHVALVYNATSKVFQGYLNGSLVGTSGTASFYKAWS